MAKIIKFTNVIGTEDLYPPEPASKIIPDWYKEIESYVGGVKKPDGNASTTATIKRCMPVFDAIISGYIIKSQVDVFVSQKEMLDENNMPTGNKIPWYEWPILNAVEFHPIIQAPNYPLRKNLPDRGSYPKWINPWSITTPEGYSCLFVQPFHRESIFTILPGIVDTDTYSSPVNFPFVLNDWSFEGLIPAGTPIAQIVPFKRDEFEMAIGNVEDIAVQEKISRRLRTRFFDSYKNQFRANKSYK